MKTLMRGAAILGCIAAPLLMAPQAQAHGGGGIGVHIGIGGGGYYGPGPAYYGPPPGYYPGRYWVPEHWVHRHGDDFFVPGHWVYE